MTPAEFIKLKDRLAELQRDYHKANGSIDTLMQSLKKDFECKELEDATALLAGLKERKEKLVAKRTQQLAKFEKQWKEKLEEYKG